jgi:hypothetical protein
VVGPNRWLVERQAKATQQNLPLKGDSSAGVFQCFPVSSVDRVLWQTKTMLMHRQGQLLLDRTFALIGGDSVW